MELKNDGGPAFPLKEPLSNDALGASLRDYFAARAPQVPDWFKHEPATSCPAVPHPNSLTDAQRGQLEGLGDWLDEKDVDPVVVAFARRAEEARAAREAWIAQQRVEKFFAWRWFYADMMLAARGAA